MQIEMCDMAACVTPRVQTTVPGVSSVGAAVAVLANRALANWALANWALADAGLADMRRYRQGKAAVSATAVAFPARLCPVGTSDVRSWSPPV